MKKLMLFSVIIAFALSANAQGTAPDLSKSLVKENSQQTIKKEDAKASESAARERAELKEKTEDLKIARLKAEHLKGSLSKDREELKKQKAAADKLESKISKREKDLAALNDRIKENETAIAKLQAQANNNKKTSEAKASKKTSD